MLKKILISILMTIITLVTGAYGKVAILESSTNKTKIQITNYSYSIIDIENNNKLYRKLVMEQAGTFDIEGYPSLPSYTFSFAGSEIPQVSIISEKYDTINNLKIIPSSQLFPSEKGIYRTPEIKENITAYSSNNYYPSKIIANISKTSLRGEIIHKVTVVPARFNAGLKKVIIAKDLTLVISHGQGAGNLPQNSHTMINNIVINKMNSHRNRVYSPEKILLLTTNEIKNAADTLALWQRKKGYSPIVIAKTNWTSDEIKDTVHNRYNNSSIKPTHLLLMGDHLDLPSSLVSIVTGSDGQPDTLMSDHPYTCITGDDFYPELSKNRIPVSSDIEALNFIRKSRKYETNPPLKDSFYNKAVAATYFQDINNDSIDDMGFIMPMEQSRNHLSSIGITSDRIYYAESNDNPQYHHSQLYNQELLPMELQGGNFAWDGNKQNLINAINDGRFLVYHYDHGFASGWGDPSFTSSDLSSLKNDTLLPVIFSIDCWVGKFWQANDCFAENLINKTDGGAVGVVASTYLSLSGYNDALLTGLIDAIWPGLTLTGTYMNTSLTPNSPIYTMADVLDQGLYRMTESWGNYYCDPQFEQQYNGYHWFGDPTLQIWTDIPQSISLSHTNEILEGGTIFEITGLDVSSGLVTLYNSSIDSIINRKEITGSTVSMNIDSELVNIGDTISLTITSHNKIPILKKLIVESPTSATTIQKKLSPSIQIKNDLLVINNPLNQNMELKIINLKGQIIWHNFYDTSTKAYKINLGNLDISKGAYVIQTIINKQHFSKKFFLQK